MKTTCLALVALGVVAAGSAAAKEHPGYAGYQPPRSEAPRGGALGPNSPELRTIPGFKPFTVEQGFGPQSGFHHPHSPSLSKPRKGGFASHAGD